MKLKHSFLIIGLLLDFAVLSAQQERIDSLENELKYQEVVRFVDNLQTQDENLLFRKAEALQKMGNLKAAIDCLQAVCDTSQNLSIFRKLAIYYNQIGDKQESLATLQRALCIEKSNALYYEIAKLQYKLRYFKEGKQTCNQILQQDTLANVLRLQSLFHNVLGDRKEAKRLLKRALAQNPQDYLAVKDLANLYKTEQDYKNILPITEAYLQLDSINVNILALNAYAYFSLHEYRKAKKLYEKLFELGHAPAEQYFYLGYTCFRLEHSNDAYRNLHKANELAQGLNETILYYLGLSAIKSLRYQEAIRFLEKALLHYLPDKEKIQNVYTKQAHAYQSLGQNMKAIEMLRKGLKYKYKLHTLYQIAYLYDCSKKQKKQQSPMKSL